MDILDVSPKKSLSYQLRRGGHVDSWTGAIFGVALLLVSGLPTPRAREPDGASDPVSMCLNAGIP